MTATREDPFDQLVNNCRIALDYIAEKRDRAGLEFGARNDQAERIEAAMAILTGAEPLAKGRTVKLGKAPKAGGRGWTEEQREAARQRMLNRRKNGGGTANEAPLEPPSDAARDAEEA